MAGLFGIGFPFRRSGGKFPAVVEDDDVVNASIEQIIETGYGERVMRPTSGSKVWAMVFENNSPLVIARIQREVRRAVRAQEKRVVVMDVLVEMSGTVMKINVIYKRSGRVRSTVVELNQEGSS